jgi:hypothetical protein
LSQYYAQPPYPQLPPEAGDEYDEYEEYEENQAGNGSGNSTIKYALAFLGGGCLVFLCLCCCLVAFTGLWTVSDMLSPTPIPGSDIGISFDDPAGPRDDVINEQNVRLSVREISRNVTLPTVPPVQGREVVVVTIEIENRSQAEVSYKLDDFSLLNRNEEEYVAMAGSNLIEGALKTKGKLDAEESLDARLVFEILAGEPELTLVWISGEEGNQTRFIALQ